MIYRYSKDNKAFKDFIIKFQFLPSFKTYNQTPISMFIMVGG